MLKNPTYLVTGQNRRQGVLVWSATPNPVKEGATLAKVILRNLYPSTEANHFFTSTSPENGVSLRRELSLFRKRGSDVCI
jgi:hypothetical protein